MISYINHFQSKSFLGHILKTFNTHMFIQIHGYRAEKSELSTWFVYHHI